MQIKYRNRYGSYRYFEKDGDDILFDVGDALYSGMSTNDDGSLYHIDPDGGPFISLDTNLKDVHRDLPDVKPLSIVYDEDVKKYRLKINL